jgi:predicted P-loop ATPase
MSPSFNPFQEYFKSCKAKYDASSASVDPLEAVLANISFETDSDRAWFKTIFSKWAAGHVTRVMHGWQNMAFVMKGGQGIGKSTFASSLAKGLPRRYFTESPINPHNKDCVIGVAEMFLWEIGEIGGTTSSVDPNMLKNFLTMPIINVRRPYARNSTCMNPMASFIGSSNDATFLNDNTGSRRWWCVAVKGFNSSWFRNQFDSDMFWGWAFANAEASGWNPSLTDEEKAESELRNETFRVEDPIESTLEAAMEPCPGGFVSNEQLKARLFGAGIHDINSSKKRWASVVTLIVVKMGGERASGRVDKGSPVKGFRGFKLRFNPGNDLNELLV